MSEQATLIYSPGWPAQRKEQAMSEQGTMYGEPTEADIEELRAQHDQEMREQRMADIETERAAAEGTEATAEFVCQDCGSAYPTRKDERECWASHKAPAATMPSSPAPIPVERALEPTQPPAMVRHQPPMASLETFDKDMAMAKALAMAGVFPNAGRDANKAYAAMLIGRDLGMGPAEALMNVEFGAQGKPVISIHWQAAQIRRAGHDFRIPVLSPTQCMVHFYRRFNGELQKVGQVGTELSELKKIAIHDKTQGGNGSATLGGKWNYRSWGEDMLYAFCMRRGMRRFYPELLLGYGGADADDVPEVEWVDDGEAEPVDAAQAADNLFGGDKPDVGVR